MLEPYFTFTEISLQIILKMFIKTFLQQLHREKKNKQLRIVDLNAVVLDAALSPSVPLTFSRGAADPWRKHWNFLTVVLL